MSERSEIVEHEPLRAGNGKTRVWQRTIQGKRYSFTAVLMPDGERRYFARLLEQGKDARFDCYWHPVLSWTFRPVVQVDLPAFPDPFKPESDPINYPTLKLRVLRRLGLPDDGGLPLVSALDERVLVGYNGHVEEMDDFEMVLWFDTLGDAVAWAEGITATGMHRNAVTFDTSPSTPYENCKVRVRLA